MTTSAGIVAPGYCWDGGAENGASQRARKNQGTHFRAPSINPSPAATFGSLLPSSTKTHIIHATTTNGCLPASTHSFQQQHADATTTTAVFCFVLFFHLYFKTLIVTQRCAVALRGRDKPNRLPAADGRGDPLRPGAAAGAADDSQPRGDGQAGSSRRNCRR